MSKVIQAIDQVTKELERRTRDLSKQEYKEVLEELSANIDGRIDAVEQELDELADDE